MSTYIIIVTGQRDWTDTKTIERVLDQELEYFCVLADSAAPERRVEFVLRHGASGNVDIAANKWGIERGVTIERFHAKWHDHTGYNPAAGPIRNREMAAAEPRAHRCVGFWDGKMRIRGNREFSGTLDMLKTALSFGIPIRVEPPRP